MKNIKINEKMVKAKVQRKSEHENKNKKESNKMHSS